MKLKKLTIVGFKSFADRVILDFDCEIVGIVGPNGCGKSNIVDAFRWVMGEQSAKSLRGDKMHDVVFAGTDKRKPLPYAEVSITLSLDHGEMVITRRLQRSGESEYFINKEPSRLRDIQGLFLGSGIGKNAFSIFEQGKLDQIIHLNPLERRFIFDEAAGTSRFLQRKRETVRKLEGVAENYARVHAVHAEIEKQTKQLKRQANHAKLYQDNKIRLEALEKHVLTCKWRGLCEKNSELQAKWDILDHAVKEGQIQLANCEERLARVKKSVFEEETLLKKCQKECTLCETKARVQDMEISQQKQRLLEMKKREEGLKTDLHEMGKERVVLRREMEKKESYLREMAQKKERLHNDLVEKKREHHHLEDEVQILREALKKDQTRYLKLLQEEGKLTALLQEKTFRYEAALTRLHTLNELQKRHAAAYHSLEQQMRVQQGKVNGLAFEIDTFKVEFDQVEKEFHLLRKSLADVQREEQALQKEITESETHQKTLNRLKEDMEGFSVGAKSLLKESKNAKGSLYNKITPLFEHIVPKKGFEDLVAASMRTYADTLVVDSDEDLTELLDLAKKKKLYDFSVLVKQEVISKESGAKKGTLATAVEENSIALHFTEKCSLVGEGLYDPLRVFFQVGAGKKMNNPFSRQAELKSLDQTLSALQERSNMKKSEQERLMAALAGAEKRRSEINEVRRKKEMDLIQENFSLQRILGDLGKNKEALAELQKERESLDRIKEDEREIAERKRQTEEIKQEAHTLSSSLQEEEAFLETRQGVLRTSGGLMHAADALFQKTAQEWQAIQQEMRIREAKEQQNASHEAKLVMQIEELRSIAEACLQAIGQLEKESDLTANVLVIAQAIAREKENGLQELKKECEVHERESAQKNKSLGVLEKERHGIDILLAQNLAERKGIEENLITTETLDIAMEEALKEIQHLRVSLESAGAVNMTAIEEFQETQARFDYLDQQMKDLEESQKELEEIISRLESESRKIFKSTFQQIRAHFQKNFALLFNGGSADLTFTESSDILEAGVEIVVKPPGKQMRSISLLSGGEKCLTALALLFAIFEVKPAPFCILDEVDAPLDESNVDRFTSVLKQFMDKTQFIVVTHNKKTMEIADLLIGVAMEEKGVSKLIPFHIKKSTLGDAKAPGLIDREVVNI